MPPLQTGSCTLINVDRPAQLTLKKTVTSNFGGTGDHGRLDDWLASRPDYDLGAPPDPSPSRTGSRSVRARTRRRVRRTSRVHRKRRRTAQGHRHRHLGRRAGGRGRRLHDPQHRAARPPDPDQGSRRASQLVPAIPADWTLTATPVDIDGQDTVSGNGDHTPPAGSTTCRCSPAGSDPVRRAAPQASKPVTGSARAGSKTAHRSPSPAAATWPAGSPTPPSRPR